MNNLWLCQKVFKTEEITCRVHFIIDKHVLWIKKSDLMDLLGFSRDQTLSEIANYRHKCWHDFIFLTHSFLYSNDEDVLQDEYVAQWPLSALFVEEAAIFAAISVQRGNLRKKNTKPTRIPGILKVEPYKPQGSQPVQWLYKIIHDIRSFISLQKLILEKERLIFSEPCLKQVFRSVDSSKMPVKDGNDNHLIIFRDPCNTKKYKIVFCKDQDVDRICEINQKTQLPFLQYNNIPNHYRAIYYAMKAILIHARVIYKGCDFDQFLEFDGSMEKLVTDAISFLKHKNETRRASVLDA